MAVKPSPAGPGSYSEHSADLIGRLRKIEGQVRGIQRMVESEAYCVEVLDQISAMIAATEKVALQVLEDHISGCVAGAAEGKDREDRLAELNRVLARFLKGGRSAVS